LLKKSLRYVILSAAKDLLYSFSVRYSRCFAALSMTVVFFQQSANGSPYPLDSKAESSSSILRHGLSKALFRGESFTKFQLTFVQHQRLISSAMVHVLFPAKPESGC
jgi:hypothetical protein